MEDLRKIQKAAKKALEEKKRQQQQEELDKRKKTADLLLNRNNPEPPKVNEEELSEIELLQKKLQEEIKKEKRKKNKDEWDVKLEDPIEFFDPELSYEIIKYRPITMTKGLDFDPEPFMAVGKVYTETGHYCSYRRGSKLYADFWNEQMRRCTNGYTVGRYTITGDHYFFLNFYRLLNTKNVKKASSGRQESFPDFYAKQYEYFHYISLCETLGKDVGALKARGVNKPALF